MKAIVIVDKNWSIGKDGQLLVHLSQDLKYFKEKTINKTIIYGRKTIETFPGKKPLPNRRNIVLSRNSEIKFEGAEVFNSIEDVLSNVDSDNTFVAGGSDIYRQMLKYVDTFYVTKIDYSFEGDSFIENLDENEDFQMVEEGNEILEKGYSYRFCVYKRR